MIQDRTVTLLTTAGKILVLISSLSENFFLKEIFFGYYKFLTPINQVILQLGIQSIEQSEQTFIHKDLEKWLNYGTFICHYWDQRSH